MMSLHESCEKIKFFFVLNKREEGGDGGNSHPVFLSLASTEDRFNYFKQLQTFL